jgi:hypothetical protein
LAPKPILLPVRPLMGAESEKSAYHDRPHISWSK